MKVNPAAKLTFTKLLWKKAKSRGSVEKSPNGSQWKKLERSIRQTSLSISWWLLTVWALPLLLALCWGRSTPVGLSGNITINKRHSIFHLLDDFLRAYLLTALEGSNSISVHLLDGKRTPDTDFQCLTKSVTRLSLLTFWPKCNLSPDDLAKQMLSLAAGYWDPSSAFHVETEWTTHGSWAHPGCWASQSRTSCGSQLQGVS